MEQKKIFADLLREQIVFALHQVKSYKLPSECESLGLANGTEAEAHSSKRLYVARRIEAFDEAALQVLARKILCRLEFPPLLDVLDEHSIQSHERISELTRRNIVKCLDSLEELYGERGRETIKENLEMLGANWSGRGLKDELFVTLWGDIERYYVYSNELSNSELLNSCGVISCAQRRFVALLNSLLRPEVRTIQEQSWLVGRLNDLLEVDGYRVKEVGALSRRPVFEVVRVVEGVLGSSKNLIFASVGSKPEIVLIDAINNDIEIVKYAELCLVYDRPLSPTAGLSWLDLVHWWKAKIGEADLPKARKDLGRRLIRSIPANSPGEHALFRVYFEEFASALAGTRACAGLLDLRLSR